MHVCVVACVCQLYNDGRGGETNLVSFYTDNRVKFDRALEVLYVREYACACAYACQGVCVCVCVCLCTHACMHTQLHEYI